MKPVYKLKMILSTIAKELAMECRHIAIVAMKMVFLNLTAECRSHYQDKEPIFASNELKLHTAKIISEH